MSDLDLKVGVTYEDTTTRGVTIIAKVKDPINPDYPFLGTNAWFYSTLGHILEDLPPHPDSVCPGPLMWMRRPNHRSPAEAFEDLRVWGEKTFGPVTPSRIVARAKEEFVKELEPAVAGDVWTDQALEEAADVVVILTRAPGLWEAIERKMAINYTRNWDVKGDGTGYHIPKPTPEPASEPEE